MAGYTLYSVNQPVPTFEDLLERVHGCGFTFSKVAERPHMLMVQGTSDNALDHLTATLEALGERPFLVSGPSSKKNVSLIVAFSRSDEGLREAKKVLTAEAGFIYPTVMRVCDAAELRDFELK